MGRRKNPTMPPVRNKPVAIEQPVRDQVKAKLLDALSMTNIQTASCQMAGISRATFSAWVREGYITQEELADAHARFCDILRGEIYKHGVEGKSQPLVINGRVVRDSNNDPVLVTRQNVRVLIAMAERYLPEWKPDNKTIVVQNASEIPEEYQILFDARELSDDEWTTLKVVAKAIEERRHHA